MTTDEDAIKAAMAIAAEIAEGKLDPADLAAVTAEEARAAFGRVVGPGDELWPLHVEVFRAVLAVGGAIQANELAEWTAVYAAKEGVDLTPPVSWIETALAAGVADEDGEGE